MTERPPLFNRHFARLRRARAAASFPSADFLFRRAAEDVAERVGCVAREFSTVAEIGARGDRLQRLLPSGVGRAGYLALADTRGFAPASGVVGEPDRPPLKEGVFDLILSVFGLHDVDDLPGALIQIRRALKPDGFFIAALPGPATLAELREVLSLAETEEGAPAGPRVHPFVDVRDAGGLLQRAGFALPVTDRDRLTVRYDDMLALMRDLRRMGEANALHARPRRALSRRTILRAADLYAARHADADGRLRASFDIVHLAGWAPHPSQPKARPPGSATMRLADALGTEERRLDDKAAPTGSSLPGRGV